MVYIIFSVLSAAVTIYTILCVIDIFLTWIPGAKFTRFGRFMDSICEPYLNLFSKISFLHVGNIDFSPIVAIGILSLLSSILGGITRTGRLYLGGILGTIIQMLWSICSTLLVLFFLLTLIRWIILTANKTSYSSSWQQLDYLLEKIAYKISKPFSKGNLSYKQALLVSWIGMLVILIAGYIITGILTNLCGRIPF